MKILALDRKIQDHRLCLPGESGAHQFQRTFTAPADLERLVQEVKPDRVVIEVCSITGWVCDLAFDRWSNSAISSPVIRSVVIKATVPMPGRGCR
jgi:hypothetical protein